MSESILLLVSPHEEDHAFVGRVFGKSSWIMLSATTSREALELMGRHTVAVVIAERRLGDGCWKTMWEKLSSAGVPPMLVVTSQDADNHLWGEVLNLGGYDVLAKPLDEEEVERVVTSAERRWRSQRVLQEA